MRDDLHHSLPQSSPWRAAVKAACSPGLDNSLAEAISRAAWASGGAWWPTVWGQDLRALLNAKQFDFFGQEKLLAGLDNLERYSPDHSARRVCEIARAVIMNEQAGMNLCNQVTQAALEAHAEDCIEQAAARIEADHPEHQAREVRRRMRAELSSCNFSRPPAAKPRRQRKSVEAGLSLTLSANF